MVSVDQFIFNLATAASTAAREKSLDLAGGVDGVRGEEYIAAFKEICAFLDKKADDAAQRMIAES